VRLGRTGRTSSPSTARLRGAVTTVAPARPVVRHFAINLVRTATDKKTLKLRRKLAEWDTGYLAAILGIKAR